ncbi:MAG: cadherin-like domain-containing protein, partial [Chloroflexota bacterium]
TSFGAVLTDGSVQDNLSSQSYDYMWRQWKGENSQDVLDSAVRNQYGQDPYFIWYERYFDRTADFNAALIGLSAFREASSAKRDNDFSTNNPNKKSRAPQTHVGWGRIWEERTDIQMMENLSTTPAHSHDVLMSLFAAQSYALITGNDASEFGTWLYDSATDPDLAEKSAYAQRVGYVTVMQLGTLDIHEPYNESAYDLAAFNGNSIFAETTAEVAATDDSYLIEKNETLSQPAPGILTNDFNSTGSMIPLLVTNVVTGTLTLNNDGSFEYIPPNEFAGDVSFTYLIADGPNTSNEATVSISVAESISQIYLPYLVR